ncbi:octaprenyl-diphosphate synthase [Alphaproteobacteria bacterium]|nr:octaprenyl-diphosphate synthase [Alphaproteobacteria bacterium]
MFSGVINKFLELRQIFEKDLNKSEGYFENILQKIPISNISLEFGKNGKRTRSILYYYFFGANSNDSELKHKTIAIIEAIHFASIVHDDVIDNNSRRRSAPSFMNKHGIKLSILTGDYILSKIYFELSKDNYDNFTKIQIFKACSATALGALLEHRMNEDTMIEQYIRIAYLKTASLFKLACFLGRYLSGQGFENAKKAATFGACFGIIFQAQNDINCYKFENFEDSEDFVQRNITIVDVILRNYMNFNIERHFQNQKKYTIIKEMISSNEFKNIAKAMFEKYESTIFNLRLS